MPDFIPYASQSIDDEDIAAVVDILRSPIITRGPKAVEFECAIAKYCGAKFAVSFNSASTALYASYHAVDTSPFDRLITTPNTFVVSITAAMHFGATPLFVDIDFETGNLDIEQVERTLSYKPSRGKNIITPVHYSGIAVDMPRLEHKITNPNTVIIEDAAHAIGSSYQDGSKVGSCQWSDMTIFSFHPAKTLTTGEGGMVTTNREDLYHRLLRYRNNGIERNPAKMESNPGPWYYEVQEIGGNYHLTEFQAALGLQQFQKLEKFAKKRRDLIALYRKLLQNSKYIKMSPASYDSQTAYHLCSTKIDFGELGCTRASVMEKLKEKYIGTQVHYIPIYRHPFFRKLSDEIEAYFPNMEKFYAEELSLPLFSDLRDDQVHYICQTLKETLKPAKAKL